MKITISKTTTQCVDIDVELPIYSEHDLTSDTNFPEEILYMRLDLYREKLRKTRIKIATGDDGDTEASIEFCLDHLPDGGMDYILGKGVYASSEKNFKKAVERLTAMLDKAKVN